MKDPGVIAIALGKKKPMGEEDMGEEHDGEEGIAADEEEQAAADEVYDAVKSGDKEAFAHALKGFVHLCYLKHEEEEVSEEKDEEEY